MRGRCLTILVAWGLACSMHPAVGAIVTYSYEGTSLHFDSTAPSGIRNVRGDFAVDQSLLPSAPFSNVDITSAVKGFNFSDGNQFLGLTETSVFSFTISLDSSGDLIGPWSISIGDLSDGPGFLTSFNGGDQGLDISRGTSYEASVSCTDVEDCITHWGRWMGPTTPVGLPPPAPVPEPPSLALLTGALGVLGFGVAVRRRAARDGVKAASVIT